MCVKSFHQHGTWSQSGGTWTRSNSAEFDSGSVQQCLHCSGSSTRDIKKDLRTDQKLQLKNSSSEDNDNVGSSIWDIITEMVKSIKNMWQAWTYTSAISFPNSYCNWIYLLSHAQYLMFPEFPTCQTGACYKWWHLSKEDFLGLNRHLTD